MNHFTSGDIASRSYLYLEEGLYLCYTPADCTDSTMPPKPPGDIPVFNFCYLKSPGAVSAPPLNILFTRKWLQQHLSGMEDKFCAMQREMMAVDGVFTIHRTRADDEQLLGGIGIELALPRLNLLSLRARCLLLLGSTIGRWPDSPDAPPTIRKTWHMQTMRQVEQRLTRSLQDMLPPQKQLAREFALSESTLKRHFKAVYGKTMYEYYLEKKMDLAKRLLLENRMNVSETAYTLGYEKVSAFIQMFKKIHKVLPGVLKAAAQHSANQ